MSKRDKAPNSTTTALMEWVGHPDDPELEHATREILDAHFDENIFKVAALAMARQELTAYPAIVDLENQLYGELFSEQRRVSASNSELVQMGKLLHERKVSMIELANGEGLEKPRLEPRRVNTDGEEGGDASQFSPKQRERMRKALLAITSKEK